MYIVYELIIDKDFHYGGCCNINTRKPNEASILNCSGNHLHKQTMKHQISYSEYKERCKVLRFEQFDNRVEAEDREVALIMELKAKYGDKCLNQSLGNRYGQTGLICSEEAKQKKREALSYRSKKVIQYNKEGKVIAEYQSQSEAARQTGYSFNLIWNACRKAHGVQTVHGYRFELG